MMDVNDQFLLLADIVQMKYLFVSRGSIPERAYCEHASQEYSGEDRKGACFGFDL